MRVIKMMERGGDEYREYKKALKKAKEAIDILCDLTEDMEDEYGRDGKYSSRKSKRRHESDDEWDD